jgi:hypothetical protein
VSWGTQQYLRSARRLFTNAVKADPGYARAYAGIADCDAFLWVNGDPGGLLRRHAESGSSKASSWRQTWPRPMRRGVALYAAGHPEQAIPFAFRAGHRAGFGTLRSPLLLRLQLPETGDFPNAALHFERAAELAGNFLPALTLLSDIYHVALGQPDRSVAAARGAPQPIEEAFGGDPRSAKCWGLARPPWLISATSRGPRHGRNAPCWSTPILHRALQRGLHLRRCRQTGFRPGMPRIRLLPCARARGLAAGNRQARHAIEPASRGERKFESLPSGSSTAVRGLDLPITGSPICRP